MTSESRSQLQQRARADLAAYLQDFIRYITLTRSNNEDDHLQSVGLRTDLQRRGAAATQWLMLILGNLNLTITGNAVPLHALLSTCLTLERPPMVFEYATPQIEQYARMAESQINVAIGKIDANLWPTRSVQLELEITNDSLKEHCLPLLRQGSPGDTVIRESTVVLETLIRDKVGHELMSRMMPRSGDQIGERLVNKLLDPANPVISIDHDARTGGYRFGLR